MTAKTCYDCERSLLGRRSYVTWIRRHVRGKKSDKKVTLCDECYERVKALEQWKVFPEVILKTVKARR